MKANLERGTVAHVNPERGFGFIEPSVRRYDGKQVYFNFRDCFEPDEKEIGALSLGERYEFSPAMPIYKEPARGDEVVFKTVTKKLGPAAQEWTPIEAMMKAETEIGKRPAPQYPLLRARNLVSGLRELVWEGYEPMTARFFEKEKINGLQFRQVCFERRDPNGHWLAAPNPFLHPFFTKDNMPTDDEVDRAERFYLAELIERGYNLDKGRNLDLEVCFMHRDGDVETVDEIGLALIGRAGSFKHAYDAFMPKFEAFKSEHLRLKGCCVAGELLGISPQILHDVSQVIWEKEFSGDIDVAVVNYLLTVLRSEQGPKPVRQSITIDKFIDDVGIERLSAAMAAR